MAKAKVRRKWAISEIFDEVVDLLGDQVDRHRGIGDLLPAKDVAALVSAAVHLQKEQREMLAAPPPSVPDAAMISLIAGELRKNPELWATLQAEMKAARAATVS